MSALLKLNTRFWQEIVDGKRKGLLSSCLRVILFLLSIPYGLAVRLRNLAYNLKILHVHRLPCPVISVGNIVAGGVGKTPFSRLLAGGLQKRGTRVAILSRGYGASRKRGHPPRVVTDGKSVLLPAKEAGDEPVMLARELEGVIVIAGADRARAGRLAIERFGAGMLILDDGYQHRKLHRDLDILLVDSESPFGNGRLIPAGYLREPARNIRRARLIFLTRCPFMLPAGLTERIRRLSRDSIIFTATHKASRLKGVSDGRETDINFLKGKRIAAFSAIARPDDFKKTLLELGAELLYHRVFPDHHYFTLEEIADIIQRARQSRAEAIVTTAKDSARLPGGIGCPLPFFYLDIEMRVGIGEERLIESVLKIVQERQDEKNSPNGRNRPEGGA